MSSALHNLPSIDNIDYIGILDSAETMCDCDGSAAVAGSIKGILNRCFRLGVESGRRFIEETNQQALDRDADSGAERVVYRIFGSRIRALAIVSRRFWPPERVAPFEPITLSKLSGREIYG